MTTITKRFENAAKYLASGNTSQQLFGLVGVDKSEVGFFVADIKCADPAFTENLKELHNGIKMLQKQGASVADITRIVYGVSRASIEKIINSNDTVTKTPVLEKIKARLDGVQLAMNAALQDEYTHNLDSIETHAQHIEMLKERNKKIKEVIDSLV